MKPLSGGALAVLRQMFLYELALSGDPGKDSPWFYVRTNLKATPIKPTGAQDVDVPAAIYCLELLGQGLICLDSGANDRKPGRHELTKKGYDLAKNSN
jgi:hypothetical protein